MSNITPRLQLPVAVVLSVLAADDRLSATQDPLDLPFQALQEPPVQATNLRPSSETQLTMEILAVGDERVANECDPFNGVQWVGQTLMLK
jgi:hypothetical protein